MIVTSDMKLWVLALIASSLVILAAEYVWQYLKDSVDEE